MNDISVQNIVKAFEEDKNILDGLSFEVRAGERVGLLGKNGAGKTTLFRIISGEIESDEGEVAIPSGKRVGIVAQIPRYPEGYTAEDVLKTAHRRVYKLEKQMQELVEQMKTDSSTEILNKYDSVSAEFQRLGGYEAYGPILQGLNAPINDLSRGCNADEVYKMSLITACQS